MNVILLVANLQKEKDYYQQQLSEAQDVIKQLAFGPGDPEMIHPLALAELLNDYRNEPIEIIKSNHKFEKYDIIEIDGTRYRQSPLMPSPSDYRSRPSTK